MCQLPVFWTACECLKKAGMMVDAPLMLMTQNAASKRKNTNDQVVWLTAGETFIGTFVVTVKGFETPLVFAVLVEELKENEEVLAVSLSEPFETNAAQATRFPSLA